MPATDGHTVLRIEAVPPPSRQSGPDEIVLSAGPLELARLDGRYLSTEVASGFTGRMLATAGAHVRSVAYQVRVVVHPVEESPC